MNTLLKAIQSALKDDSTLTYLKRSVHIIPEGPDHDVLPDEAQLPMIGITDGSEDFTHRPVKIKEIIRRVRITAYKEVMHPSRSIVGDDAVRGVIDILKDAQAVLEHNTLNLSGYVIAQSEASEASTVVPLGDLLAVKKTLLFRYKFNG